MTTYPDGGMFGSITFDTTTATNDTNSDPNGQCGGYGHGQDLAYLLVLPVAVPSVSIAESADQNESLSQVNYIRAGDCEPDGGQELACARYGNPATTGTLPAGPYTIWVDGVSPTAGTGTLYVSVP